MLYFGFSKEAKARVSEKFFAEILARFEKVLEKRIKKALKDRNGQLDLVLVDDEKIHGLNLEYRDMDEPTDVIAFAYLEVTDFKKEEGDVIVGDIFISADTAKRQAKEKKHSLKRELEVLFVHGLLHLFGFDHKTDKEEKEMEKWAAKVLS